MIADTAPASQLTTRERQILALLARGCSGRELAPRLNVSEDTVRTHIRNAMRKLGARTRVQAVVMALELGLLDAPGLTDGLPELSPARTPGSAAPASRRP